MTGQSATTRDTILIQYRPIRRAVQNVLAQAVEACQKPDFNRAAKHLNLLDEAHLADDTVFEMLCDVALFEPNQRGRRVFDGFLRDRLATLDPADQDVARRMGGAFVSIFRVAERTRRPVSGSTICSPPDAVSGSSTRASKPRPPRGW